MDTKIYNNTWFLYVAECRDKTLYTGIAKDVDKRINEHNTTNKCRYTRFRKPLRLMHKEICINYSSACMREIEVKKFSRKKKLDLISH